MPPDGLSYIEVENYTLTSSVSDLLLLRDDRNYDSVKPQEYNAYSTLLVKNDSQDITAVSEPSTIALMFGAMFFFARNIRRNQRS